MRRLIEHLENLNESRVVKVRRPIDLVPKNKAAAVRMVETSLGKLLNSAKNPRKATRELGMGMLDGSYPYIEFEIVYGRVLETVDDEHDIAHSNPQWDRFVSFDVPGKFEVDADGFMPAAEIDSWMRKYIPGFKWSRLSGYDQQAIARAIAASEIAGVTDSLEGIEGGLMEFVEEETSESIDWGESSFGDSWDVSNISYLAKNGVRVRMRVTVNDPRIVVDLDSIEPDFDEPW